MFHINYKSPDGGLVDLPDRDERERGHRPMTTLQVRFQGMEYDDHQISRMTADERAANGISNNGHK